MFFDAKLQAFTMDVIPVPEDSHVILQFQLGVVLPGPDGRQGLLPVGAIKVPVGYKMAQEFEKEITDALADMKPPSDLAVVTDMDEARRAAEVDKAIRSGA